MNGKSLHIVYPALFIYITLCLSACRPDEGLSPENNRDVGICAVLAHPDDETIIGGTLAMLEGKGFDITAVYVTSGDEGADETGRGLHGNALGMEREKEAQHALQALGIGNPPVFLRFPDSQVSECLDSVRQALADLFDEIHPEVIIGFGPDGITGNWDHRYTGMATDSAFDLAESGRLLLHMAVTKPLSPFYAGGIPVPKNTVDLRVNVSGYAGQRVQAVEAHRTQFNSRASFGYKLFVHAMRREKFIIVRNRDAGEWLERCFDIKGSPGEKKITLSPEARFKTLEDGLLNAQAVRMAFRVTAEGAIPADITGTLDMGKGTVLLQGKGIFAGDSVDLMLRADSSRVEFGNQPGRKVTGTPPELREAILVGLTRMGILHNLARLTANTLPDHADGGVRDWVKVDSFAPVPQRDPVISFVLTVSGTSVPAKLEISPPGLPVERRQTVPFPSGDMRVIERYSSVMITQ